MNYCGIYSSEYKNDFNKIKKFDYPNCIKDELDAEACMYRLLSYFYDKYFLVKRYKDNILSLGGMNNHLLFNIYSLKNILYILK